MSRRRDMLRRLDEDIRDHIERETAENIENGMAPDDARYAALRRFGSVHLVKEWTREVWIATAAEQLWQDVRFGLRMLLRNPAFAFAAIFTLGIAIGVNTAVFSVVNTVLLRALPYPDANRLVVFSVGITSAMAGRFKPGIEGADFAEWQTHATILLTSH